MHGWQVEVLQVHAGKLKFDVSFQEAKVSKRTKTEGRIKLASCCLSSGQIKRAASDSLERGHEFHRRNLIIFVTYGKCYVYVYECFDMVDILRIQCKHYLRECNFNIAFNISYFVRKNYCTI